MGKRLKEKATHHWMSPAAIETVARQVYGDTWRGQLCTDMDISYSQLHRYMTLYKGQGVPKTFALSLLMRRDMARGWPAFTKADEFRIPIGESQAVRFSGRSDSTPSAGLDFGFDAPPAAPAVVAVIAEAKQTMAKAEKAARAPRKAAAKPIAAKPKAKPYKATPAPKAKPKPKKAKATA